MDIPSKDFRPWAINTMRECELASRTERRDRNRRNKALYMTGTESSTRARYNSLKEWARRSSSMIFNGRALNLKLEYPPYYGGNDALRLTTDEMTDMTEIASEEFGRLWHDSTMPKVCGQAVRQAHYLDTSVVKLLINRNEISLVLVPDPSDICVGNEAMPWEYQEVICHFYRASMPTFWRMLQGVTDKRERGRLWEAAQTQATAAPENRGDVLPGALPRIILASASPTMVGTVANTTDTMLAQPKSKEPMIELCEMWVWDDNARRMCAKCLERKGSWRHAPEWVKEGVGHEFEDGDTCPDWRVITIFDTDILYDAVNPLGIEGHAFFPLCLEPPDEAGYIWGVAPMEDLIRPQLESEQKWQQLDDRDELAMNPPMSGYGIPMRDGEITKGYRKPGADIALSSPQAKVEFHKPPELADRFEFVDRLDAKRQRLEGIPKAMTGEVDPSMRAGEQMQSAAMLGAGPTLDRAMVVEGWLEGILTSVMRLHRNMLATPLVRDNGERFLLRQLPGDFVARVWGHSASPVYTEHLFQKAVVLRKTQDISGEDLLLYANLPGTDTLRRKHKKIEQAQAERSDKVLGLKEKEVEAKVNKSLK